jgi:hypothetical protein
VGWGPFHLPGERRRMERLTRKYKEFFDAIEKETEQAAALPSPVEFSGSSDSTSNLFVPGSERRARQEEPSQPGWTAPGRSNDELDGTIIRVNFDLPQIEEAMRVFGLDPAVGTRSQLWFGDIVDGADGSEALPLLQRGITISVRGTRRGGNITLQLRGPDGCIDVTAWRSRTQHLEGSTRIVGDWAGARRLVSASLSEEIYVGVQHALSDSHPGMLGLMPEEQRLLASELMVPLHRVVPIGPIGVHSWDLEPPGDVAAELWTIGDAIRFLEVSVFVIDDPVGGKQRLEERALAGGLALDPLWSADLNEVLQYMVR